MKVVGGVGRRPRARSVGLTPIFFAELRAAVRVGRPERVGNAADRDREAVGQIRLRPLLTSLPAAAAIGDQEGRM